MQNRIFSSLHEHGTASQRSGKRGDHTPAMRRTKEAGAVTGNSPRDVRPSLTRLEAAAIDIADVVQRLDIGASRNALEADWEQSQAHAPGGPPPFLDADYLAHASEVACVPEEFRPNLLRAAKRIAADEAACALIWHAHWWMFESDDFRFERVRSWPRLVHSLGEEGGLFYLLALLSGVDSMRAIHREHDIPDEIIRDTMSQIALYLNMTVEQQGFPEVIPHLAGWLMNHLRGVIYKFARLQFQFGDSRYRIRVFRNDATGQVVALSEEGVRFRPDGQLLRDGDDPTGAWTAHLSVEGDVVEGNPIVPTGHALRRHVELPADRWRQVLAPGDPVLHIHIPGGEPMHYDNCGRSFEMALEFFPAHFPDYRFNAFMCGSWILNTAIQQFMPAHSNLVRFQREVYLFPIGLSDSSLPQAIFDEMPADLTRAPRDTSMRRGYVEAMLTGGLVTGGGGCFLLPEDVNWGAQVYLSQEMPW